MTIARHDFDTGSAWRGEGAARTISISAIAEQASGVDDRLGALFQDMRRCSRLDRATLARRVGATVDTLMALELGDVRALRPGPELQAMIDRYARLVNIDPRPVYDRIVAVASPLPTVQRQSARVPAPDATGAAPSWLPVLAPAGGHGRPSAGVRPAVAGSGSPARRSSRPPVSGTARPQPTEAGAKHRQAAGRVREARNGQPARRRKRQALLALGLPATLLAAAAWLASTEPARILRVAAVLPPPASWVLKGLGDAILEFRATRHDGLKWIDVADPGARKSDKLRSKTP